MSGPDRNNNETQGRLAVKIKDITDDAPSEQPLDSEQQAELGALANAMTRVARALREAGTVGEARAIEGLMDEIGKEFHE